MSYIKHYNLNDRIPWFKTQIIRMGILDLTGGYGPKTLVDFLDSQKDLGGDLQSLKRVAIAWSDPNIPYPVGESGTIYRFVAFHSWKNGINRPITIGGTLEKRVKEMKATPEIVHWPLSKLLTLEGGTTQWATMAILMGNNETLPEIPFYLRQTYDAIENWNVQRGQGKVWLPQKDITLTVQVEEYIRFLKTGKISIRPNWLGDCDLACFLMTFGVMTTEQAKELWPQIQYHESNRPKETRRTLRELRSGKVINTDDHRVAQAFAMLIQSSDLKTPVDVIKQRFHNPNCVNKTWPQFWNLLADISKIL